MISGRVIQLCCPANDNKDTRGLRNSTTGGMNVRDFTRSVCEVPAAEVGAAIDVEDMAGDGRGVG
jgi:hypothetical protein